MHSGVPLKVTRAPQRRYISVPGRHIQRKINGFSGVFELQAIKTITRSYPAGRAEPFAVNEVLLMAQRRLQQQETKGKVSTAGVELMDGTRILC